MASRPSAALVSAEDAGWHPHETSLVLELALLGRQIPRMPNGTVDVDSRDGRHGVSKLLRCMDKVTSALKLDLSSQSHRQTFSDRLLVDWVDRRKRYGLRLFVACVQQWREVVLNNQVFTLTEETVSVSRRLNGRWSELGCVLSCLRKTTPSSWTVAQKIETKAVLEAFDKTWDDFEQKFLGELQNMQMEAQNPLEPVQHAMEHACNLDRIQARYDLESQVQEMLEDPEYQEEHRLLVDIISRLNMVANPKYKGCAYTVSTLNQLEEVIEQYERDLPDEIGGFAEGLGEDAVLTLAVDAIEAFNAVCSYFFQLRKCVDQVNPVLRHNKGLVRRLQRWEDTWEIASSHVLDPLGRQALTTLMASIQQAKTLSPELDEMREECSADFFLVLPRLVWLSFLSTPMDLSPELQCMLHHRFVELRSRDGERGCCPNLELQGLLDRHSRVVAQLAAGIRESAFQEEAAQALVEKVGVEEAKTRLAKLVLARCAILGLGSEAEKYAIVQDDAQEARESSEALMREIEGWSMELQRHCAQTWNCFVAVVVRCLDTTPCLLGKEVAPFQI